MPGKRVQISNGSVLAALIITSLVLFFLKIILAALLDLYSDEVFYWQASSYPALAYSDLPFMTSLLVGIGSSLDPGNPFAVRILFIFPYY